jgi:predicted metal-dependent phosphoesterase TrpH
MSAGGSLTASGSDVGTSGIRRASGPAAGTDAGATTDAGPAATEPTGPAARAFLDLHCHTAASFDSFAAPRSVVRAAAARGLTHLAITDHGTLDGALEAQEHAPAGLTVLVGEEIRTLEGDLIGVFLSRAIPKGLPAAEAIAAIHEQGGLAGIPHPFDRLRGSLGRRDSLGRRESLIALSSSVDWIEAWNARLMVGDGNARAAELAASVGRPGVAVSDAHTTVEVGVASTIVRGDPSTPDGLRAALAGERELVTGHPSLYVRLVTPVARLSSWARSR